MKKTKKADIKTVFGRSPFVDMDGEVRKLYRQYLQDFQQMIANAADKNPEGNDLDLVAEVSLTMEAMVKAVLHMIIWFGRMGKSKKDEVSRLEILATVEILSLIRNIDDLFPGEIDRCRDRRNKP